MSGECQRPAGVNSHQRSRRWALCFPSETFGVCCAAAASVCHHCVSMWDALAPKFPINLFRVVYCPQAFFFGGKKAFLAQNAGLCGSLFTALACDGGDTRSLPITDCHFDGDATGGESNSLSPSLWNTVYSLEGHKAASEHRDTHFHARTHIHTRS